MQRGAVLGYLARFGVCLLIAGGIYAGYTALARIPPARSQPVEVAALRAALNESYLRAESINSFEQTDAVAGQTLDRLVNELRDSTTDLQQARQTAAPKITPAQNEAVQAIINKQKAVVEEYRAAAALFSKPLAYDPASDLNALELPAQATLLSGRATAAANGLSRAAGSTQTTADSGPLAVGGQNGPDNVLTTAAIQALNDMATCFRQLAEQVNGQPTVAAATRARCISEYPALRLQLLDNLLERSVSDEYIKALKADIAPLLKAFAD